MVVGGLLLGTLLTLFVIPTMYTLMVRKVRLEGDEGDGIVHQTTPGGAPLTAPHQREL